MTIAEALRDEGRTEVREEIVIQMIQFGLSDEAILCCGGVDRTELDRLRDKLADQE